MPDIIDPLSILIIHSSRPDIFGANINIQVYAKVALLNVEFEAVPLPASIFPGNVLNFLMVIIG